MSPVKRRIAKRRRRELSDEQFFELMGCEPFFGFAWDAGFGNERLADEQRRETWALHRDELLAFWISGRVPAVAFCGEHGLPDALVTPGGPGTRPAAWWAYDAPEPCRALVDAAGALHPVRFLPTDARFRSPLRFEVLSGVAVRAGPPYPGALLESEAAYLKRHRLLSSCELAQLDDAAFRPVAYHDPRIPSPRDFLAPEYRRLNQPHTRGTP